MGGLASPALPYEETVRRLRPLARRRLRTSRPFFVLMRTRKPCVRFRRRRLGWNVRFMMSDPLAVSSYCGETKIVANHLAKCQLCRAFKRRFVSG
jgi:hypothetical protein